MPLIAVSLFKALDMVQCAVALFDERHLLESTSIAPVVKAKIGYERTASLVAKASSSGQSLLQALVGEGVASEAEVRDLLRRSSRHPDA